MKYFISLILLAISALSSTLLTYNIYEREDRVDVMLSFDAPHDGKIFQKKGKNITSLTLLDLTYDTLIEKSINSNIVQELSIEPLENSIVVTLKSTNPIAVYASKTVDGFGLRIRAKIMVPEPTQNKLLTSDKTAFSKNANKSNFSMVDERYMIIIGIMLFLLIFLFWLKRKIKKQIPFTKTKSSKKSSWLFKDNTSFEDFHIVSQKPVDTQNKIVLINFHGNQYLVLTGATNLFLDKFGSQGIKNEDDFETIFEENRQKLDKYLKLQQNTQLNSYKQKVSNEYIIK